MSIASAHVFIATSLDGFIARLDGNLDWLDAANATIPAGEDCGFAKFLASMDCLVMGRNTFDKVLSFGTWPYGDMPVVVMTSRPLVLPDFVPRTVRKCSTGPAELARELYAEGMTRIYVDGGVTIRSFLFSGLVEEITITTIPVLLGTGIPLFGSSYRTLELLESRSWSFGFVQSRYRVIA